jgi:transposase
VDGWMRGTDQRQGLSAFLCQRDWLQDYATSHIQRLQKALAHMNLQLHHVVTHVSGVTRMAIIRAIVAGERDSMTLVSFRDRCYRAPIEKIQQVLFGNHREEHVFALSQALESYDAYQANVAACDIRSPQELRHAAQGGADG